MIRLLFIFALFTLQSTYINAAANENLIDGNLARKALSIYSQNPLGEEGQSAGAILFLYASKSKQIKIALREELVPWIKTADPDDPMIQQLLVAYIAGNVQSQLERGQAIDDPYSAIQMVLKVYGLLQEKTPRLNIPELEQFESHYANRTLREHLVWLSSLPKPKPKPAQPLEGRVDYPMHFGAFEYVGTQTYATPEMGISLRYGKGAMQQHYFDIYIYPIPDTVLNYNPNTLIKSHYRNAKSDIYFAQRQGLIQDVKLDEEKWLLPNKHKHPIVRGIFEMQRDHMLLYSTLYITVKNKHYIKLRATYPKNDATSTGEHMMKIFENIVDQVLIY